MDVLEIDAASNNGVDNIREIIETVKYPPTEGRYKVYIIDETHMLSIGAFNALLKTLEDPPLFVVFILATTEYQKVPATIFSRCQRFDFRRIPYNTILTELNRYIAEQNINITKGSVEYIANMADGSLRDALSILDQCLATFLKPDITEDILEMFGGISHHVLADFLECLIRFDTIGSIKTINNVINSGKEVFQFITELLIYLRNLLLVKTVDNTSYPFNLSDERLRELKSQSQNVDEDRIVEYLDCFSGIRSKLRHSNEKILLEVMCIKLCKPEQLHDNNSQAIRLARLESLMEVDNGSASQGVQISEEDIIKQRLPFAEIR
jgi:DNA polymerase-3 subunit gamma/tau